MTEQAERKVPRIRFKGFEGAWEEKTFDQNILSIQTGTNLLGSITGKGTPLLKMGNIQRGSFSFERLECLDENAKVEPENIAHFGDFLFNTRNTLDLVGKGATWMGESGKFAFNNNLARFKFQGINTVFFNYLYNTSSVVMQVKARAMGTTSVAAIYPKNLNSLKYSLPTPAEQTQIGTYFRELDQLIDLHQRKHDKLVTLKKAMLQKMFPQAGASTPEIRFKGFEGDWTTEKLGEVATLINGRAYSQNELLNRGRYRVLRVGNFYTNSSWYFSDMELGEKYYAKKGDLLYTWSASFGPHIWAGEKVIYHYHIWKVELSDRLHKEFILQLLENDKERILSNSSGSTMVHITKSVMESKEFIIPPKAEQQKIGTYFSTLDVLISKHATQLKKLKQIKSACLEKMFV